MTDDQRADALGFLGLTPRQTRFVMTVALHGGYCLRRQYATFARIADGATVRDFLDELVRRHLMTRVAYRRDRGFIYHLQAKRIYEAIEQEDNRNRRPVSPALMARKLMLLDVVLAHPGVTWVATEADKVALFTERFRVPLADLPQRTYLAVARPSSARPGASTTRYFLHKWPIGLDAALSAPAIAPPRVRFVVLILDSAGRTFAQFLNDHRRLVSYLPAWSVMAVCPAGHGGFRACQAVFDRATNPRGPVETEDPDLSRYFQTRLALEVDAAAAVSDADWAFYRDARTRCFGPEVDERYAAWRVRTCGSQAADRSRVAVGPLLATGTEGLARERGALELYRLPFTYHQFGDFAGEC